MVPCDVNRVFVTVCQHCHSDPRQNDAPFALVTYVDIKQLAGQIDGAVVSGTMPEAPYSLTSAQRTTLLGWLDAGAHGVPVAACP